MDLGSPERAKLVEDQLAASDPRVLCVAEGSLLVFCTESLLEGEVDIVAKLLRSTLRS